MASYTDWNQALISYFIDGVPRGTRIYLSVDEDVIENIGYNFTDSSVDGKWIDDFNSAVRKKVIVDEYVNLKQIKGKNPQGFPQGVAFLCACVLAASLMGEEEKISEKDYFKRLRETLALPGFHRPQGMKSGSDSEEPLWKEWNLWLMQQGFLVSAQPGSGPTKYTNYPISQCLLRRTDKDKLQQLFQEKKWQAQWDALTLFVYVKEVGLFGKHLRDLLTEDRERYDSLAEEIYQVYEQWQEYGYSKNKNCNSYNWSHNLSCGLYRTESFLGDISYSLYPKQKRRCKPELIEIQINENNYQSREERPGWYYPLDYYVNETELEQGCKYQITSPNNLDYLVLPDRDFWILVSDPDNYDSGAFASWGKPSPGNEFILLCKNKKELLSDIHNLRDKHLLEWSNQPSTNTKWIEIEQCMVVSHAWDKVIIKNQALKDALQPSVSLSISLSGGLRVPKMDAWLIGYSPQITIFGLYPTVKIKVTELANGRVIMDESHPINVPINISLPHTGEYIVQAFTQDRSTPKCLIRIVDWNKLEIEKSNHYEFRNINDKNQICGSIIQKR